MSSSQHHTTGRDARRGALLLQLVALLFASLSSGRAETAMPGLVIQREIGETLVRAVLAFDGSGTVQGSVTDRETACAGQHLDKPRLAVVAGAPRPLELEACRQTTGSEVLAMTIGYQAVALVVPADAPAFPLGVTDLFRAVAGHSDQRPFPVVWRDVDPNLPALPIGFLAPPIGSVASRLFDTYVMEPACSRLRGTHAPFELARRMEYCIRLRADPSIVLRNGGSDEIADWAKSAPAGRPAVVSLAELRQLDQIVVAAAARWRSARPGQYRVRSLSRGREDCAAYRAAT